MKKKKGAEILWNNEKVEEKSGKKTILQIFLPKFHFSFFLSCWRVPKHEFIDNTNAQRTIEDGNLQSLPAGNWKERRRLLWDKRIQKKDELLEECKFFVVVIDHAFECFVFEEKWRKIHWGYSFFHGNEIYRDLNKQDNRKRERKRCTFPRCFSFFFYLSSRDNFTTLCMHFLFLSTHFLYFLYQANFQGNISI